MRVGHRGAHLAGALQVDLEQCGLPAASRSSTGRRGVPYLFWLCTTAHSRKLALGDHPVELVPREEHVVDAVHLARPGRPRRRGDREPDLGIAGRGRRRTRSPCRRRSVRRERSAGRASSSWVVQHSSCGGRMVTGPRTRPHRSPETVDESLHLVRSEAADAPRLGDSDLGDDRTRLDLADAGQRLEKREHLQLADRLVRCPCAITSESVPWEYFRRFLTSARPAGRRQPSGALPLVVRESAEGVPRASPSRRWAGDPARLYAGPMHRN